MLTLCPGSKNVWIAHRLHLPKVSQEQLRMTTMTERVANDLVQQELQAIAENSAADGQALPKYLDFSRNPPSPSADESTQTSPEERAERRDRFESRSSAPVAQEISAQSSNKENKILPPETATKGKETEVEKSASSQKCGKENGSRGCHCAR